MINWLSPDQLRRLLWLAIPGILLFLLFQAALPSRETALQAGALGASGWLIAVYAWWTRDLVLQAEEQATANNATLQAQFRPIIAFGSSQQTSMHSMQVEHYVLGLLPLKGDVAVNLKNIGTGPALNIEVTWRHPRQAYDSSRRPFLGAGESPLAREVLKELGTLVSEDSSAEKQSLVATYEDIFGNKFRTRLVFLKCDETGFSEPKMSLE